MQKSLPNKFQFCFILFCGQVKNQVCVWYFSILSIYLLALNFFYSYTIFWFLLIPIISFPTQLHVLSLCLNEIKINKHKTNKYQNKKAEHKSTGQLRLSVRFVLEYGRFTQCHSVRNWLPLSQQVLTAKSFLVSDGSCARFPSSMLGFWMAWTCTGLAWAMTASVRSCGHQLCCVCRCCRSHPPLWLSQSSHLIFRTDPWALKPGI